MTFGFFVFAVFSVVFSIAAWFFAAVFGTCAAENATVGHLGISFAISILLHIASIIFVVLATIEALK